MAKRFTDTKIWDDPWYQELPMVWKFLWKYLCDKCDEAGIYKVNKSLAEFQIGTKIKWQEINSYLNKGKIRVFQYSDDVWVLVDFVKFQYGNIENSNHSFHKRINQTLSRYPIDTLSNNLSSDLSNRSKEKEIEEVKEKEEVKEEEKEIGNLGIEVKEEGEDFGGIPTYLHDIWPAFLEMRKAIKKPATKVAERLLLAKLEKIAPKNPTKQREIVLQSIENSWQGLFSLKNDLTVKQKFGRQEVTTEELREQMYQVGKEMGVI